MINTNELMLKNWLKYNNSYVKVCGIEPASISIHNKDIYLKIVGWEDLDYIPISSTILKKCEFKSSHGRYINEDGYSVYHLEDYWYLDIGVCGIRCNYLHQLQNLYFLITGKQLEVNL